jgi:ubiquinone/menaquinone biosynthesis C-methylase UbiE
MSASFEVSGRLQRLYAGCYAGTSAWRELGARDKAANVVRACGAEPHASVLEIGMGEGALLARLCELGFAKELHGVDISPSAVEATRSRRLVGLVSCEIFDGYTLPHPDRRFDLAILSHVLEHVEHPRRLLSEAARVARSVVVEVPLEDTWRLPRDFTLGSVGHINFFTARSLRRFVQSTGLAVETEFVTHPSRALYEFHGRASGALRYLVKAALLRLSPPLAMRLFTYHATLRCAAPR